MKKIILGVAAVILTFTVRAEYLSWYVGESFTGASGTYYNGTHYDTATLYVKNGDTTVYSYTVDTAGGSVDYIGDSGSGYTYLIEVYKYEDSSTKYASNVTQYSDLSGAVVQSLTSFANVVAAWNGAAVVATPEPTSGLLMLMGFAMLGLKRKKEV